MSTRTRSKSTRAIGIHVSISKGVNLAVSRALEVGCLGTFQIFTSSPRRWAAPKLVSELATEFKTKSSANGFVPIAHMPYMPNLSSPEPDFYKQSVEVLIREIGRCDELDIEKLVLHFGSPKDTTMEEGHVRIVEACKRAISETPSSKVKMLLETSSGSRNSIGSRFEYVRKVLEQIGSPERSGVCFDTCHVFGSGYDIRTPEGARKTISEFDRIVGISRLYLIHINDSKGGLGEGMDRHEHIGLGQIGMKGFRALFEIDEISHIPFVLETPIDSVRDDKQEVAVARELAGI